jgi:hypothetical protein
MAPALETIGIGRNFGGIVVANKYFPEGGARRAMR